MAGAGAFEKVCFVLKFTKWHEEMTNINRKMKASLEMLLKSTSPYDYEALSLTMFLALTLSSGFNLSATSPPDSSVSSHSSSSMFIIMQI